MVQVARCLKNNMKVAIKRIDLERCGSTIEELQVRVLQLSVSALAHSSLREGSPHIINNIIVHFYSIETCPRGHPSVQRTIHMETLSLG